MVGSRFMETLSVTVVVLSAWRCCADVIYLVKQTIFQLCVS